MQRLLTFVLGLVLVVALGGAPALAEKRVALVVGNDRYQHLSADQQLRKAVNDARAVGDALVRLGFEVIRGENLGRQALIDKLDELTAQLSPGDTAFFFFAGHGVAIGGGNYILPVDVPLIEGGQETRLARAALGESDIVSDLQGRGVRVAVVVLDACRSNPFRRPGTRSVGGERGLTRIEPVRGVFSLYSAGVGQTALDRLGNADPDPNSVFTRVLIPALGKPGLHLGDLAIEVREEVARLAKTVGHQQRPAYYDETIGGKVYLAGLPPPGDPLPPPSPPRSDPHAAISNAAAAAIDSVVKVSSHKPGQTTANAIVGSGFILDASGLVVVTNHTIIDATNITVTLKDGTRLKAELVGRDQKTDLALLRIKPDRPLKAVKLGASDQLKVGERIIVIGHPQGLDSTVTDAMITGLNRTFGGSSNHIQINVAYKGMGPLFNLGGELVGISAAFMNPEPGSTLNFGFAIPSAMATVVIDQLRDAGMVRRGWLGARSTTLTDDLAESLGLNSARGVLVAGVDDKGPAKLAGIEPGDVIIRFDGKELKEQRELSRLTADTPPGKQVEIIIFRKGKEETKIVTLGLLEEIAKPAAAAAPPLADVKLAELSADLRARYRIKETVKGVVITDVVKDSAPAQRGLTAGTVIQEVGSRAVATPADVNLRIDEARKGGRNTVLLRVFTSDDQSRFVVLPVPEPLPVPEQTAKVPEQAPKGPGLPPGSPFEEFFRELKDRGRSGSGWIGLRFENVTQAIAGSLGLQNAEGAMVADVTAGGPAAGAGITRGDVIVSVGGTPVKDSSELSKIIAGMAPGTEVKLVVLRNFARRTFALTLGTLPPAAETLDVLRRKTAENDATALAELGDRYSNGKGVTQDYAEARRWYEKAANMGNVAAMFRLGWLYDQGRGGPADYAEARRWYEKAATLGNASALNNLGALYEDGRGVPKNYAEARRWYEKAAEKGNAQAMKNLGSFYSSGRGVPKDYAEARRWLEKAAALKHAGAMNGIGVLYHNGEGVPRNYAEAWRWYEKAAALGDAWAMFNIGKLYEFGNGVAKSRSEARNWYQKAAAAGHPEADRKLRAMR